MLYFKPPTRWRRGLLNADGNKTEAAEKAKQKPEKVCKISAPGEDRTHGLQIMRLTRCLLRYRGLMKAEVIGDIWPDSAYFWCS